MLPANMVVLLKVLPMPFVEKCIFTTKSGSLPSTILKKSSITSPIIMAMLLTMITLVFLNSITGLRAQKRSSLSRTRVVSELSMVCRYRLWWVVVALMGAAGTILFLPHNWWICMSSKMVAPSIGMRFSPVIMLWPPNSARSSSVSRWMGLER